MAEAMSSQSCSGNDLIGVSETLRAKSQQLNAKAYRQFRALDPRPADVDHGPLQLQVCVLPHGDQRRGICGTSVRRLSADGADTGWAREHEDSPYCGRPPAAQRHVAVLRRPREVAARG